MVTFSSAPGSVQELSLARAAEIKKPVIIIKSGPILDRAMRGMRHALAAMAAQGNNIIVDVVMTRGQQAAQEYRDGPGGIDTLRIVAELADRERTGPGLTILLIRLAVDAADPAHPAHDYFSARYREINGATSAGEQ